MLLNLRDAHDCLYGEVQALSPYLPPLLGEGFNIDNHPEPLPPLHFPDLPPEPVLNLTRLPSAENSPGALNLNGRAPGQEGQTRIWNDTDREFATAVFTNLEAANRGLRAPESPLAPVVRFYEDKGWPLGQDLSDMTAMAREEAALTEGRKLQMFIICPLQLPADDGKVCPVDYFLSALSQHLHRSLHGLAIQRLVAKGLGNPSSPAHLVLKVWMAHTAGPSAVL